VEETLLEAFATRHPSEAADALRALDDTTLAIVLARLSQEAQAAVLTGADGSTAVRLLSLMPAERAAAVVLELDRDVGAHLLRRTSREVGEAVLRAMPTDDAQRVARHMRYPEDTAGALMDPLVNAFRRDLTVAETLERIRREPKRATYYVYVVDERRHLEGVVTMRELMLADETVSLATIMRTNPERLRVYAPWETVAVHPGWRRAHALPVVDGETFVGAIRYRTLRAVEQKQVDQDLRTESSKTARELAEVYALGASSLLGWVSAWLGPVRDREGGK
jgi:magnesium transporter